MGHIPERARGPDIGHHQAEFLHVGDPARGGGRHGRIGVGLGQREVAQQVVTGRRGGTTAVLELLGR